MSGRDPLLKVTGLNVTHRGRGACVHAVRGVDLEVGAAEIVGLAGESGCGKTTLGSALVGLVKPDSGTILIRGTARGPANRGTIQMVFQDPHASLNPRMTVGAAIAEVLRVRGIPPLLAGKGAAAGPEGTRS